MQLLRITHVVALVCAIASTYAADYPLRIMTMNIWNSGAHVKDGLHKVAKHIQLLDPDIVALQELDYGDVTKNLTQWLGPKWTSHVHSFQSYPDTGVITKHKILVDEVGEVWSGVGVPVAINKGFVSVVINLWSMHLDYTSYGPYAANNKQVSTAFKHSADVQLLVHECVADYGRRDCQWG
ncbi:Protein F14F9.5, partial [Aphelenchoides avenae]